MDLILLRQFQHQVAFQCHVIERGATQLDDALARVRGNRGPNVEAHALAMNDMWAAIQTILTAAANISKACWGQKGKGLEPTRRPLRDSLEIDDNSPLRPVWLRNRFDHFDEDLDHWWATSKAHNNMDFGLISPLTGVAGIANEDRFRVFDPNAGVVAYWENEVSLLAIVREAQRIHPIAVAEAAKSRWNPSPSHP